MKLPENIQTKVLSRAPQLIQHFYSLEGEGGTIGRSALFIRTNQCNCSCTFCDTSFSISGKHKPIINDMTSDEYYNFLLTEYTFDIRKNTKNLSITGGEPLINILHFQKMVKQTISAFPNINKIIIETNGYLLQHKEICLKLIDELGIFTPEIKFILSISPKLNAQISHAGKADDKEVLANYRKVLKNYRNILDANFDIQLKMVHSDVLKIENEKLLELNQKMDNPIPNDKILIMPFTPNDPLDKDAQFWSDSKDAAAKYSLQNHYRYSPRIHIDRRLD